MCVKLHLTMHTPASNTHTFRPINFVSTDGHEVNVHGVNVHRNFAHSLSCIRVQEHLLGSTQLA